MTLFQCITAAALVLIAWNTAPINKQQSTPVATTAVEPTKKAVRVVGKYITSYDALGAGSHGFVVQDGNELRLVSYDPNSTADRIEAPKYLAITVFANGHTTYSPIEVR